MATLTLELADDLLERAEAAAARMPGRTLQGVLLARVNELGGLARSQQREAFQRLIEMADAHGGYIEGGMPVGAEERNAR